MDFLGKLYCSLFEGLFGQNLAGFLWGYDCYAFNNPNLFNRFGLIAAIITLVMAIVYYFILDPVRFHKRWHWIIVMLVAGVVNMVVANIILLPLFNQGLIPQCLSVSLFDCWMFGIANGIMSMFFFLLWSFILKRFATNTVNTPWRSLWP